jgi:hypothetical protein
MIMNESAFPYAYFDKQLNQTRTMYGMNLRDYFAAKAMQPINSQAIDYAKAEASDMARKAYMIADAMIKARAA